MKNLPLSFLFFCLLHLLGSPPTLQAQLPSDTIYKYYYSIVNPGSEVTISEGIKFYTRKKEIDLDSQDTLGAIHDLRLIAIGEYNLGNINDSEIAVVEALTLIDNYSKKDTLVEGRKALYNQLGNIYRDTKNYNKAIQSYNLSLRFSKN